MGKYKYIFFCVIFISLIIIMFLCSKPEVVFKNQTAVLSKPKHLLFVRVLRPTSDEMLKKLGHNVRSTLDSQGLQDVAVVIIQTDFIDCSFESLK